MSAPILDLQDLSSGFSGRSVVAGGSHAVVSPYTTTDELKTKRAAGACVSIASTTIRVPSTFTDMVRARSSSDTGGSTAARCTTTSTSAHAARTSSGSVSSPRAGVTPSISAANEKSTPGRSKARTA